METGAKKRKPLITIFTKGFFEVPDGFEPPSKVLQTSA